MLYLLKIEFTGTKYYVECREDGGWNETYNPNIATLFQSKREAMNWAKKNTSMSEYMSTAEPKTEYKEFEKWVEGGMIRREFPPLASINRKYKGESAQDVLDWWVNYQRLDEDEIQYEVYETWPDLSEKFSHLLDTQSYLNGDDLVHSFSVYTSRNGNFNDFKKEVDLVEPHITHLDDDGGKILDVFDHFLSEGGNSVYLILQQDGMWRVDGEGVFGPDDPKKVFDFLRKYRYYE